MPDKWDQYAAPAQSQTADKWDQYAQPSSDAPPSLMPGNAGSGPTTRFLSNAGAALNPIPGLSQMADEATTPGIGLRKTLESHFFDPQAEQAHKAMGAIGGTSPEVAGMDLPGRLSTGLGHGLAAALPMVGPAAANAAEQVNSGDVAGGLGSLAGTLAGVSAVPRLAGAAGRGMMRMAEPVAENALGIRGVDRKFGRNPGRAVLDETAGVRPESVSSSAGKRIGDLSSQRDAFINASTTPVHLQPGLDTVRAAIAKAQAGNSDVSHLRPMEEQLTVPRPGFQGSTTPRIPAGPTATYPGAVRLPDIQHVQAQPWSPQRTAALQSATGPDAVPPIRLVPGPSGQLQVDDGIHRLDVARQKGWPYINAELQHLGGSAPQSFGLNVQPSEPQLSPTQLPRDALPIRQRFGNDFTKFDAARPLSNETRSVGNQVYGKLTDEIHRAVPESAPLDKRISNLIPARDAAGVRALAPGMGANVLQRVGAKTGSMAAGAFLGRELGNLPAGLALGAVLPEVLSNPTSQMIAARGLNLAGKGMQSPLGSRALQLPSLIRPQEPLKPKQQGQ